MRNEEEIDKIMKWRHEIAEAVENGDNNLCMDCGHTWEANIAYSCQKCGGDGGLVSELDYWHEFINAQDEMNRAEALIDRELGR